MCPMILFFETIFNFVLFWKNDRGLFFGLGIRCANGNITRVGKGGTDTYNMAGISYWKRSDALIIKKAIEASYKKPGHEKLFWDEIVDQELKRLKVQVEEISPESVIEVDTLEELSQLDSRYKTC